MKRCPKCQRSYTDETLNFHLDDGSDLLADRVWRASAMWITLFII